MKMKQPFGHMSSERDPPPKVSGPTPPYPYPPHPCITHPTPPLRTNWCRHFFVGWTGALLWHVGNPLLKTKGWQWNFPSLIVLQFEIKAETKTPHYIISIQTPTNQRGRQQSCFRNKILAACQPGKIPKC